jgi:hypothetical protein
MQHTASRLGSIRNGVPRIYVPQLEADNYNVTDRPWGRRRGPGALRCLFWQVGDRCAPRHDLVVVVERPVKRHCGTDRCGAEGGVAKLYALLWFVIRCF